MSYTVHVHLLRVDCIGLMLTYFCNSLGALGYTSVYLPEASSPVGTAYKLPVDARSTCSAYLLDELTPIIFLPCQQHAVFFLCPCTLPFPTAEDSQIHTLPTNGI